MSAMKQFIIRVCQWTLRKLQVFQPTVILWDEMSITEMVLADAGMCYCPLPVGPGHCVDLGYDFDGKLIAIKIWGDVSTRDRLNKLRADGQSDDK